MLGTLNSGKAHSVFILLKVEDKAKGKNQAHTYTINVFNTQEGNDSNRQNLPVLVEPNPTGPVFNFEKLPLNFKHTGEFNNANPAYVFERVYIAQQ